MYWDMVKQPVSTKKNKYENCHLQADHFPYNFVLADTTN
jgi:hypothetical protein